MQRRGHKAPVTEELFLSWLDCTGECWIWQRSCIQGGYGTFVHFGGKGNLAHRFAYELWVGPIPDDTFVLHHCDNPPCCNPEHLFLGTHKDNMRDMVQKRRQTRGEHHPRNRLSEAEVKEIRMSSLSSRKIAPVYGVNARHIRHIRSGDRR